MSGSVGVEDTNNAVRFPAFSTAAGIFAILSLSTESFALRSLSQLSTPVLLSLAQCSIPDSLSLALLRRLSQLQRPNSKRQIYSV